MCVNYNNGKIYKIVPKSGGDKSYVGSTTRELLCQRMQQHRTCYIRWKKGLGTKTTSFDLFDQYGVENCEIILLELVNCHSRDELKARERFWIESTNCVNKTVPLRSIKEWTELNKETIKKQQREYRETHPDYQSEYRETHPDYQREYRERNLETIKNNEHKKYERDKEVIKQRQREYYTLNNEAIKQKQKERYEAQKKNY